MKQSKQHIDELIRKKMEGLEAAWDPNTWDRLDHRLDFEAQQSVDEMFKKRLGEMEASNVSGGNWDALQKRIEAEEAAERIENEAPIDEVAYEKLHNLQHPYNDRHWALMAKRLEEEFSLRHILYRYKIAEIALMGLLLLTFFRFMPMMEKWLQGDSPLQTHRVVEQKHIRPPVPSTAGPTAMSPPPSPTARQQVSSTGNVYVPSIRPNEKGPEQEEYSGQLLFASPSPTWRGLYLNILPKTAITPLSTEALPDPIVEQFDAKQNKLLALAAKRQGAPRIVDNLLLQPFNHNYGWELSAVKAKPFKKKSDLRFSVFTTTDLNYVTTPPDQISVYGQPVNTDYGRTLASGYGGGVTVSWKKNRWEYQTGGIYSFKRYVPNTPIFIFETINYYIKEDFNGIQLDILQVPLNALYHFKNTGKWRFYASTGSSAHFITSVVYEFDYDKQARSSAPLPPASPDENKSITQEKDFPEGLLNGGSFRSNFYLSANIGFGIERYLSPRWTVFFQPNYQHFFLSNGVSTNKDKIYTTSFHLGTKFNLK